MIIIPASYRRANSLGCRGHASRSKEMTSNRTTSLGNYFIASPSALPTEQAQHASDASGHGFFCRVLRNGTLNQNSPLRACGDTLFFSASFLLPPAWACSSTPAPPRLTFMTYCMKNRLMEPGRPVRSRSFMGEKGVTVMALQRQGISSMTTQFPTMAPTTPSILIRTISPAEMTLHNYSSSLHKRIAQSFTFAPPPHQ